MTKQNLVIVLVALTVLIFIAPMQYVSIRNELAVQSTIRAAQHEETEVELRENTNECCVQCTTPKGECCLLCSDRASPREHDLLMAAMEGLTHHVMETFNAANHPDEIRQSHSFLKTRAWESNSHIGNRPLQATFYYDWIRSIENVTQVCEIGMNGGHSAFIFLAGLHSRQIPWVNLAMFDLATFEYSEIVEKYIKVLYPGMFTMYVGNSRDTVPRWIDDNVENGLHCDIFSVDGDHTYEGALIDIRNAAKATKKGGYIILDDMNPENLTRKAFDEVVRGGILEEPKCVDNVYTEVGYENRLDKTRARGLKLSWCTAKVV